MKHPIQIVINALMAGQKIRDKGFTYCFSDKNRLAMVVETSEGTQAMELDFSFNSMLAWAEKLPEEELFSIVAGLAIQNEKI